MQVHSSLKKVYVSAGRIGAQLTLAPEDFEKKQADATFADVFCIESFQKKKSFRTNADFQ